MTKPNVILFFLDDLGWRDLGCYGSTFYETPVIDQLSRDGMTFTQAYASCPVCSPSRASLLSGKYPARVGVTNYIGGFARGKVIDAPYIDHLPLEEFSLARSLKDGGYQTWHLGKWHLGSSDYWPEKQGFDVNIGGSDWGHPVNGYFAPWGIETLSESEPGTYLTDRLTDEAIALIENDQSDKPFFMNFWHYAVHNPIEAPAEDIAYFEAKAKRLKLDQINPFVPGENFPCDHKKDQQVTRRVLQSDAGYAAMIKNLDQNIGRLLEVLTEKKLLDDTVIIFTSDNGGLATSEGAPTCNAPLSEGKGWMYEGGIREPLMIRYPKMIRSGSFCEVPVTTPDLYPTLLELAGLPLKPQQHVDGVSLVPLLSQTGEKQQGSIERDTLFWHFPHYGNQGGTPAAALRQHQYKLIRFFEDDRTELYDLEQDIAESENIADQYPELVSKLSQQLDEWLDDVDAKIPLKV